jgi:predicted dehydrogenase
MTISDKPSEKSDTMRRRDFLMGLATIPVLGGLFTGLLVKQTSEKASRSELLRELGIDIDGDQLPFAESLIAANVVRLGIIGAGNRGTSILQALGFNRPDEPNTDMHPHLYIELAGVCDVYEEHAQRAINMSGDNRYTETGLKLPPAKRFNHYQDMLNDKEIDAVIIATPDHWHAQMVIEAVQAGKHIYCEKCLTRTLEETYNLYDVIKNSAIKFQYGHQNRQQQSYNIARQIIAKQILGKITVIKTHTNRNTPRGAWVRHLDQKIDPDRVNWEEWLGSAPDSPFTPSKFFGWQKFFEYSGGLPPHMFSHEYDAINQTMSIGIPKSVSATGGIYYWKDERNTPDVMQALFEYPDREMIMTYDATLASSSTGEYESGAKVKEIFGSEAWMKLGMNIHVLPDRHSKKYKAKLDLQKMTPSTPFLSYTPGGGIDAVTSASDKYYARQGLIYTYKGGKKINVTYLHVKDWLDCIRNGGTPACNIDLAFEDTVTCLMATKSYQEGRRVFWDATKRRVV